VKKKMVASNIKKVEENFVSAFCPDGQAEAV